MKKSSQRPRQCRCLDRAGNPVPTDTRLPVPNASHSVQYKGFTDDGYIFIGKGGLRAVAEHFGLRIEKL